MIYLPDVNLWLALTFESHVHHRRAAQWFAEASGDESQFCRLTQQGFLRLATNPLAFGEDAVTLAEAWRLYDAQLTDPQVSYAVEPPDIELSWRAYTQRQSFSSKVWNDAYLAAFARHGGSELVTFDQGFSQYEGLTCQILR